MATTPAANSSPQEKFSDDELALLTEEERAHLNDDLGDNVADDPEAIAAANAAAQELEDGRAADKKAEEDAAAAQKAADDKAKADADAAKAAEDLAERQKLADAGDEAAKKAIADQKALDDAAALKASQDAAAAEAAKAKPAPRPRDGVIERAPVMVEAEITKLDEQLDAIAAKFDEGDITAVEMRKQESEIRKQQRELSKELAVVAVSSKTWGETTVPEWLDAHPEYKADPDLFKALDKEVRDQQTATRRQYDPTFLDEAHKKLAPQVDAVKAKMTAAEEATVRRVLGLGPTDPLPKKAAVADPAVKDPKLRKMPPNLGALPQSDIADVSDGGKYAALDRLSTKDPLAYEAAMAKMSVAERNAYLAQ